MKDATRAKKLLESAVSSNKRSMDPVSTAYWHGQIDALSAIIWILNGGEKAAEKETKNV